MELLLIYEERKGKYKIKRVENHKIKVTIEVDMVEYECKNNKKYEKIKRIT